MNVSWASLPCTSTTSPCDMCLQKTQEPTPRDVALAARLRPPEGVARTGVSNGRGRRRLRPNACAVGPTSTLAPAAQGHMDWLERARVALEELKDSYDKSTRTCVAEPSTSEGRFLERRRRRTSPLSERHYLTRKRTKASRRAHLLQRRAVEILRDRSIGGIEGVELLLD
jgi:hypothetical protein